MAGWNLTLTVKLTKVPFLARKRSGWHNVKMGEYPHNSNTLPVSHPPYFSKVASSFNDPNNAACVGETIEVGVMDRGGRRQSVVTLVTSCKLALSPVTTSVSLTHNYTYIRLHIFRFWRILFLINPLPQSLILWEKLYAYLSSNP